MAIKLLLAATPPDIAVLEHALSRWAWDIETEASTDGYHSVEVAVVAHPSLVIVDPVMPRLFGPELIRRLRAAAPTTPILCWAGSPSVDDAAELLRAGANGYILKDDGPGEVIRAIEPLLGGGAVASPTVAAPLMARLSEGIHRERELAAALADATMKVQEVTHTKAEFLANVSHELRTPVTIVKGIAHLLKERQLSREDEQEFLEKMDQAIDRLTSLVDEILSISDLDRGKVQFSLENTDVSVLVGDVCYRVGQKYPLVKMEMDLPQYMGAVVDPARLSEAVAQLVDNACRFSPPGRTVEVSLRYKEEGVVFSVTDSGIGLRRDVASLAFSEPFITGEEVMRKERAGVGLGLHLARRLVLLHGGIMWVDPLPRGGTRVSFCIPAYPPGVGAGAQDISSLMSE